MQGYRTEEEGRGCNNEGSNVAPGWYDGSERDDERRTWGDGRAAEIEEVECEGLECGGGGDSAADECGVDDGLGWVQCEVGERGDCEGSDLAACRRGEWSPGLVLILMGGEWEFTGCGFVIVCAVIIIDVYVNGTLTSGVIAVVIIGYHC